MKVAVKCWRGAAYGMRNRGQRYVEVAALREQPDGFVDGATSNIKFLLLPGASHGHPAATDREN